MSDARHSASNFHKATKVSVKLAVKGFVQQIEYLNGLLKTAHENIKSSQDKIKSLEDEIKTLTAERDAARFDQKTALRIMLSEEERNTKLVARIAEVEEENDLLKAQHDQNFY
jgi:chromosome segregation ATPase